jgi:branched-chain amino acid transport system ATP-binding protein
VVLLDEPSSGLSADEVRQVAELLKDCREKGIAIVVVEHNLRLLRQVADVVTVLDGGRVIAHGTPDHVFEDELVRRAYLGPMDEGVAR